MRCLNETGRAGGREEEWREEARRVDSIPCVSAGVEEARRVDSTPCVSAGVEGDKYGTIDRGDDTKKQALYAYSPQGRQRSVLHLLQ